MNKVLNKICIKGNPKDLKVLLEGCHQTVNFEDGTTGKANLTFNEYVPVTSLEEAKEKWGVSEDSLAYYDLSFDEAEAKIEECKNDTECEASIVFETYDGIVLNWVKAMAKANPKVEIRYCVFDKFNKFYAGYKFDLNTNNLEYKTENYKTAPELQNKFLNQDIEKLMEYSISTAKFNMFKGLEFEEDFRIDDAMDYLKDEYRFLSEKEFNEILNRVKERI